MKCVVVVGDFLVIYFEFVTQGTFLYCFNTLRTHCFLLLKKSHVQFFFKKTETRYPKKLDSLDKNS